MPVTLVIGSDRYRNRDECSARARVNCVRNRASPSGKANRGPATSRAYGFRDGWQPMIAYVDGVGAERLGSATCSGCPCPASVTAPLRCGRKDRESACCAGRRRGLAGSCPTRGGSAWAFWREREAQKRSNDCADVETLRSPGMLVDRSGFNYPPGERFPPDNNFRGFRHEDPT